MDRRSFLVRTGLTFAATALASLPATSAPAQQVEDWSAVQSLFSLNPNLLHFGGLYLASHPAPVRQAIDTHRRALDDNPVEYLHQSATFEAQVLRAAAGYIGGNATDIALTDSTTMGLGLLYTGLMLAPGDEIVSTVHDFYSTTASLQEAASRSGAAFRQITLYQRPEATSVDEIVQNVVAGLSERTRVVAVTWVHSSTGVKLPIRAIADAVHAASERILLCVDGVHGFGVEDVNVADLGCDFFVSGTHKWILGPRGTGLVWGRGQQAWSAVRETIPTFGDGRTPGSLHTPGGFHSFEHRWALRDAFDLHQQLGRSAISGRIHALNTRLKLGLSGIPNVKMYTPLAEDLSAGLVCFDVAGLRAQEVVDRLRTRAIIATTTPYATSYARLAAGVMNSEDQVDQLVEAVRAIA
jgi:isopenicillin-N epimerase